MSRPHEKGARRPTLPGNWILGGTGVPEGLEALAGQIMVRWGFLEQQFDALLSISAGSKGLGKAIRSRVRGSRNRRELLAAIAKEALTENERLLVQPLLGRYVALVAERNVYVHGVWGAHSAYPGEAILARDDAVIDTQHFDAAIRLSDLRERAFHDMVLVSDRDLSRFLREMDALTGDLIEAFYTIQGQRLKQQMGL